MSSQCTHRMGAAENDRSLHATTALLLRGNAGPGGARARGDRRVRGSGPSRPHARWNGPGARLRGAPASGPDGAFRPRTYGSEALSRGANRSLASAGHDSGRRSIGPRRSRRGPSGRGVRGRPVSYRAAEEEGSDLEVGASTTRASTATTPSWI